MSGKIVIGSPKDNAIKITGKIDVSRPITSISPSGTVVDNREKHYSQR